MPKNKGYSHLEVKAKGNYPTRYKSSAPNLDMKEQKSTAYKSRYSSSLIPENESEIVAKSSYKSRY